jgi:hypothetical protein
MAIFSLSEMLFGSTQDDMARARAQKKDKAANDELISSYVERLTRAVERRPEFETVLSEIKSDSRLAASDVITIAHRYNQGGKKPSSKATALAAISKRFVEIVRFHAKNRIAEKVRPW